MTSPLRPYSRWPPGTGAWGAGQGPPRPALASSRSRPGVGSKGRLAAAKVLGATPSSVALSGMVTCITRAGAVATGEATALSQGPAIRLPPATLLCSRQGGLGGRLWGQANPRRWRISQQSPPHPERNWQLSRIPDPPWAQWCWLRCPAAVRSGGQLSAGSDGSWSGSSPAVLPAWLPRGYGSRLGSPPCPTCSPQESGLEAAPLPSCLGAHTGPGQVGSWGTGPGGSWAPQPRDLSE